MQLHRCVCVCTTCAVTREYMWMQLTDSEIDRNHCRLLFVISHKLFSMAFSVRWKKIFLFIFFFAFKYSWFCYLSFWINRGKFVCNNFCVYLNWKNNGTRLRLRSTKPSSVSGSSSSIHPSFKLVNRAPTNRLSK